MMKKLVQQWVEKQDEKSEKKLIAFLDSEECRAMPYEERNDPFITASKLSLYEKCPYFAKLRFIDRQEPEVEEERDAMTVGMALDDRLTYGEEFYHEKYAEVQRRGSKAAEGDGRIELTNGMAQSVEGMAQEYREQTMFPKELRKHHIVWLAYGKFPCKAELDYFSLEERRIGDLKSSANVLTFDPSWYRLQMAFYFSGVLEKYREKCVADLFVVDKHTGWSRSHTWRFSVPTLEAEQGRINNLILQWTNSAETGLFPMVDVNCEEGRRIAFDSPYYSLLPECRSTEPTIL